MDILIAAITILTIIVFILISYIVFMERQMRSINTQLDKRLTERTRQPIRIGLQSRTLNELAFSINKCLKEEENLRIKSVREEKRFKEMIADISHDLRTPLTAIMGYQQLVRNSELSEYQSEKLQIAQKHASELGSLIEHFFEYSYLLNAEPILKTERINLTNFVTERIVESVTTFEANALSVDMQESEQIFVNADRELLMRILQNLIRNCTDHASGVIEVRVYLDEISKENAVVSFKNTASDMTDKDAEMLFDRFYTKDRSRGRTTGLGLSIVRLLAKQLGGETKAVIENGILDIQVRVPVYRSEK